MHVHLPKPLHGWREFIGEVGIIVIGVLIALGAEQVVEKLHWQEKANHARIGLREELSDIYYSSAERIIITPCLNAQLDKLLANVLHDGRRAPLSTSQSVTGPTVYQHPSRLWGEAIWQSTITEQVSSHLTESERSALGNLYASVAVSREMNRQEWASNGSLMVLATPLQLNTTLRGQLVEAIANERLRVNAMRLIAEQQIEKTNLLFPRSEHGLIEKDWLQAINAPTGTVAWCRRAGLPLSPMPK